MKKRLDEKTIASELSGASKFFDTGARSKQNEPLSKKANDRTDTPNGATERSSRSPDATGGEAHPTVATELTDGVIEEPSRPTERYSFEAYTDQRRRINDIQARYQIETGRKLSASRIVREALDAYLETLEAHLNRQ